MVHQGKYHLSSVVFFFLNMVLSLPSLLYMLALGVFVCYKVLTGFPGSLPIPYPLLANVLPGPFGFSLFVSYLVGGPLIAGALCALQILQSWQEQREETWGSLPGKRANHFALGLTVLTISLLVVMLVVHGVLHD